MERRHAPDARPPVHLRLGPADVRATILPGAGEDAFAAGSVLLCARKRGLALVRRPGLCPRRGHSGEPPPWAPAGTDRPSAVRVSWWRCKESASPLPSRRGSRIACAEWATPRGTWWQRPPLSLFMGVTASFAGAAGHARTYSTPATAPLATAVVDPTLFAGSQMATAFARTQAAGATYARLTVYWRDIAPSTRPTGFVATDPTSPGYSWEGTDAVVEAAGAADLTPILDITAPPVWGYETQPTSVNGGRRASRHR